MKPLRRADLAVLALGIAVATWLVVRVAYGQLPPLHWWLPAPLGILAVAEALGTRTLRARLTAERKARAAAVRSDDAPRPVALVRPVEPMLVARLAVLAQASAYVGAVCAGLWAGVLAHVGPMSARAQAARSDTVTGVLGLVCAAALVAAALWLESVCRIPPGSDDDSGMGTRAERPRVARRVNGGRRCATGGPRSAHPRPLSGWNAMSRAIGRRMSLMLRRPRGMETLRARWGRDAVSCSQPGLSVLSGRKRTHPADGGERTGPARPCPCRPRR